MRTIPGVNRRVAEVILAEIGTDMTRFATPRHLTAWAGLAPGNYRCVGERLSGRILPGNRSLHREFGGNYFAERKREAVINRLVRRLEKLGYQVALEQDPWPAVVVAS